LKDLNGRGAPWAGAKKAFLESSVLATHQVQQDVIQESGWEGLEPQWTIVYSSILVPCSLKDVMAVFGLQFWGSFGFDDIIISLISLSISLHLLHMLTSSKLN